jgi:hypothetical protein
MRASLAAASAVLLIGVLGCSQSRTYHLKGSLTAPHCLGGYNIIDAAVTVRNEKNEIIASTTTTADDKARAVAAVERSISELGRGQSGAECRVQFQSPVPVAKFYQITIGTHSAPSYSFDEMHSRSFAVDLDLK